MCLSKHLLRRHIWGKFRSKSKPHFHFNSFWQRLQTPKIKLSWLGKGENRWEIGLDLLAGMVLDERLISKQNSLTFLFCKLFGRWTKTFRHPSSPKWHFQFRLLGPRTRSQKWRSKWWIGVQVELFISVSVNSVWPLISSSPTQGSIKPVWQAGVMVICDTSSRAQSPAFVNYPACAVLPWSAGCGIRW